MGQLKLTPLKFFARLLEILAVNKDFARRSKKLERKFNAWEIKLVKKNEDNTESDKLISALPETDDMDYQKTLVEAIFERVDKLSKSELPFNIGLFGGWGTGKTTILGYLAKKFVAKENYKVIYFNAWKYASFTEIFSALVYRLIKDSDVLKQEGVQKRRDDVLEILFSIGQKHLSE